MYAFSVEPRTEGEGYRLVATHLESNQQWEYRHGASLDHSHVAFWALQCTNHVQKNPDWQPPAHDWEFKGKAKQCAST